MKLVAVHTDFRLYWPARLEALHDLAQTEASELHVVEISGAGSNYDFASTPLPPTVPWTQLFPDARMEDVSPRRASDAIARALDNLQPDVVIASALAFPSGATAVGWCATRGVPCVLFDDVRRTDVPRSALHEFVKQRLFSHVDAMILPAPAWREDGRAWGLTDDQMFFGLDVVANERFAGHAEATRAGNIPADMPTLPRRFFLGVGRQVAKKNWSGLLRAYASLLSQTTDPSLQPDLVLVGNGPERTGLEDVARATCEGRVTFIDFQDQERLASIYARADGLILPSTSGETWGLVVNEAMACSLPVVVSQACGCAATLVKPEVNGWIFEADDGPGQLTRFLSELAGLSPQERRAMGDASRRIIAGWDVQRFAKAARDAAHFALKQHKRAPKALDRAIFALWKGRYRPT